MMSERAITCFKGENRFLSNFWPAPVSDYQGLQYPTAEHAYQALKTLDLDKRLKISKLVSAREAKKAGKTLVLRDDWDSIKYAMMIMILRQKFAQSSMKEMLLDTHPAFLVEGNEWGDNFWGYSCDDPENMDYETVRRLCEPWSKHNHLGRGLMLVREECRIDLMRPKLVAFQTYT